MVVERVYISGKIGEVWIPIGGKEEGVLPFAPPRKTGLSECKECKSVYPGVYFSTPGKHVIFANIKKRNNAI